MVRGASRHLLSLSGLGALLAVFAQGLTSCGSDDDSGGVCDPGALRACVVAGQSCEASQTCNMDGSGYGECACPSQGSAGAAGVGGSGGGSSGGAAGAGGGGGDIEPIFPLGFRAVGAPCETDADCPAGPNGETPLICMTPTSTVEFGTGSPQGGYCTAVCSDESDNGDCVAVDGLSACGLIDNTTGIGFCIGLCQPGAAANAIKCGADRAQACFQFPNSQEIGACFPVCQSDEACGEGLFCDLGATGLGLCTATAPVGGDIGAPCTPETAEADCKSGACVTLLDPETGAEAGSFCSANCTLGLIEGCGFPEVLPEGTARDAVCLLPQVAGGGGGDLGFCFELCDTDADCAQAGEGWVCVQDLGDQAQAIIGRSGECLPPAFAEGDGGVLVDAGN